MPQLDKVTFLSQYVWLCVFYIGLYVVLLKYFLPRLSRILLARKRRLNVSGQGMDSLHQENRQLGDTYEKTVSSALSASRTGFSTFFARNQDWVANSVQTVNKTQYQPVNATYLDTIADNSLAQHVMLYHATTQKPAALTLRLLVEKMKSIQR